MERMELLPCNLTPQPHFADGNFVEIGRHSLRVFNSNLNDTRVSLRRRRTVQLWVARRKAINGGNPNEITGVRWP
jgi:hypothetical protein